MSLQPDPPPTQEQLVLDKITEKIGNMDTELYRLKKRVAELEENDRIRENDILDLERKAKDGSGHTN